MRRPNIRPEGIRGGGFAGGASAGATRPVQGNSLQDLARGLESLSGAGRRYADLQHRLNQQDAAEAAKRSAEEDAYRAELFERDMQGASTADMIAAVAEDPELSQAGPNLAALLQNSIGRTSAREMADLFVQQNPDSNDPGAFREFVGQQAPQIDGLASAAFNDEIDRFASQFDSQARSALRQDIIDDAMTTVSLQFDDAYAATGDVSTALSSAYALLSDPERGMSLNKKRFNDVKWDLAQRFRDQGMLEEYLEVVNFQENPAVPSLAQDSRFRDEVSEQFEIAESKHKQVVSERGAAQIGYFQELTSVVDLDGNAKNPATLRMVRNDPRYATLTSEQRTRVDGMAIAGMKAAKQRAERQATAAAAALEEAQEHAALIADYNVGNFGRINRTQDEKNVVIQHARRVHLNGNITNAQGPSLTAYVEDLAYKGVGENRLVDPALKGNFGFISTFTGMDPAELAENEEHLGRIMLQWQAIPASLRPVYAEGNNRAFLESVSDQLNSGVSLIDAVQQYQAADAFNSDGRALIADVASKLKLSTGDVGWFDGPSKIKLSDRGIRYFEDSWGPDYVRDNLHLYKDDETFLRVMKEDFAREHIAIEGNLVRLPRNKDGFTTDPNLYRAAVQEATSVISEIPDDFPGREFLPTIPNGATEIEVSAHPLNPDRLMISYTDPETGDRPPPTTMPASMVQRIAEELGDADYQARAAELRAKAEKAIAREKRDDAAIAFKPSAPARTGGFPVY